MEWFSGKQNAPNQYGTQGSQYGTQDSQYGQSQYGTPGSQYGQRQYGQRQYGQNQNGEINEKLPVYYTLDGSLPKSISQMFGETYANSKIEAQKKAQTNLQSKGYTLDYQNPTVVTSDANKKKQYEVHFISGPSMGGRRRKTKRTRKTKKAKKAKRTRRRRS